MSILVGNKAQGKDFFDREREREDIWRYLEGNHILLSGPRRLVRPHSCSASPRKQVNKAGSRD